MNNPSNDPVGNATPDRVDTPPQTKTATTPATTDALGSVWVTGHIDLATQVTQRGYHPDTATDAYLMPPAIAAHVITTLTHPQDVVLDPDCGAGTTLVEALHSGRHTIGLTGSHHDWQLARANLTAATAAGAPPDGMVLVLNRRPSTLATAHLAGFTARVDLVLTTLRPATAHPGPDDLTTAAKHLQILLRECRALVRPGGHVVITTPPWRDPEHPVELIDVPSQILAAGIASGFTPAARCIALTADLRGPRVRTRATRSQRRATARLHRLTGHPFALPAHHTALVFRADREPDRDAAEAVLPAPVPAPSAPTRRHRVRRQAA
jgi:modification methylase